MTVDGWKELQNSRNIRAKFSEKCEKLFVIVNLKESHGLSASGKTTIIASTEKWVDVMESGLYLSLSMFAADPDVEVPILLESIRTGVDVDPEMGFSMDIFEDQHVRFTIDCTNEFGTSKSGKSTTVATSEGILKLGATKVYLKLHAYRKVGMKITGFSTSGDVAQGQSSDLKKSRKRSKPEVSR